MGPRISALAAAACAALLLVLPCCSFSFHAARAVAAGRISRCGATPLSSAASDAMPLDSEARRLKEALVALAAATRRGFSASRNERDEAKRIINDLAKYSTTDEPAAAYYDGGSADGRATLAGKWTLLYTDAPDITSLDGGPFATAQLGRIGQECEPPSIKNVIEWRRPQWAAALPFSGGEGGRVLQKVCCEGRATKEKPRSVDLTIAGLELSGVNDDSEDAVGGNTLLGPAQFLSKNPVTLRGPLTSPFGKFDILYLDDGMRITKTYQGYYAVNVREETAWF